MAIRRGLIKADTPVQGDDAWVQFTRPVVGEVEDVLKASEDTTSQFGIGVSILSKHIVDWNWVDYDGSDLPVPKENPEVVRQLTIDEYQELIGLLLGSEEDRKN